MPFIQWEEGFVTGVGQFDEHHRHLVGLLNKTYDDFICGAPDEDLGVILDELVEYATYHFGAEENWMRDISYPKLSEHKNEHDSFFKKIVAFQNEFHSGKTGISLDVLTFLKRWLKDHILESDAAYGQFIPDTSPSIIHL
jgi:hemerythrin